MFRTIAFTCGAFVWLCCPSLIRGQCIALSVQQPDELQSVRSLVLGPLSISPHAVPSIARRQYKEEPLDELSRGLGEQLRLNLENGKLFRSVEYSRGDGPASSELTLAVEITSIWQGSKSVIVPIVARSDPSVLEVSGTITSGDGAHLRPVLEFLCRGLTGGVIVKSRKWMHENIDQVAEGLVKLLRRISLEKRVTGAALTAEPSKSLVPIEMILSVSPSAWADSEKGLKHRLAGLKPPWSPVQRSVSGVGDDGTVVAVLVTKENFDRLLLLYSRMLSINQRTMFPNLEDTDLSPETLSRIFRETWNSEERMLWVWYARRGTTYWNKDTIAGSTSLVDLSNRNELRPIRTLIPVSYQVGRCMGCDSLESEWVYNSAILIFPDRKDQLSARPGSSDTGFELHTQLDNRPVLIRF